jgi:hypothetical protein
MKSVLLRALAPLVFVFAGLSLPAPAFAADSPQSAGAEPLPRVFTAHAPFRAAVPVGVRGTSIVGAAWNVDNTPIPGGRVRLRNVTTGKIESAAVTDDLGQFTFTRMDPGSYVIELVSENGKLLSVGQTFTVGPGETVATFIRLGSKAPWFDGFFKNAAAAVAAAAASTGVTAIAPEKRTCVSACAGQ